MTNGPSELTRETAREWTRALLAGDVDALLAAHGFKRSARSLSSVRPVDAGTQKIEFGLTLRPGHAPDAAQLTLVASVVSNEVVDLVRRMLGDEGKFFAKDGAVRMRLLDQIIRNPPTMLFREKSDLEALASRVTAYLTDSVLPYLDRLQTIQGLVRQP